MGIFDRFARLLKSNLNDAIDKSEDPEKMLKQIVEELNEDLLQVRTQVASSIAVEKQLFQKAKQFQDEADKWQSKAELAVDKGEDELAREALKRKSTAQQTADGFKHQWEEQKKSVVVLKENLTKLESKISEAQTKKDLLIARHRRAGAEARIQQTLSKSGSNNAMSAFERMETRVNESESLAAAHTELNSDSLEDKFAALGSGDGAVNDELAALKARKEAKLLGAGGAEPTPGTSPTMRPLMDHIQWTYTWRSLGGLYDLGFLPIKSVREQAIRELRLEPGMRVLDLACGTGLNLPYLARAVGESGEVVGVDYTRAMLERAKLRCERLNLYDVRLIEADASALTLADGSFDAVICTHALSIIPRSREALRRAVGALVPGGRLVVADVQRLGAPMEALEPLYDQVINPLYEQLAYNLACSHPGREIAREMGRLLDEVHTEDLLGGAFYVASGVKPAVPRAESQSA